MGLVDKFKNLVNPIDNDNGYDDDEYVFDGDDNAADNSGFDDGGDFAEEEQPQQQSTRRQTSASQGSNVNLSGATLELKVIRPDRWEDVFQIADHLINGRTVVLNLENTNKELSRRMIDCLLGVVYTIEGDIKKVAQNTWVLTPKSVDISQEQKNNGHQPQRPKNSDPYGDI